jgi:hypothetical protein
MLVRGIVSLRQSSITPVSRWLSLSRPLSLSIAGFLLSAVACTGTTRPSSVQPGQSVDSVAWNEGTLFEAAQSARDPAPKSLEARLSRLDLLLDLFDAARFGPDAESADALWAGLALEGAPHGAQATRQALTALLELAMQIEADSEGHLGEDPAAFLASAIMLLNVDVNRPADADQLEVQTLAHRSLRDTGHPRVRDNAHWRLYDHSRDAFDAALRAPPESRAEVGLHVLLLENESLLPWLSDAGAHARASRPSAQRLIELGQRNLAALQDDPRWRDLAAQRAAADAKLHAEFVEQWPAPPLLAAPLRPAGFGRDGHALPLLQLGEAGLRVGPTSAPTQPFGFDDAKMVEAIAANLKADGRLALFLPLGSGPRPKRGRSTSNSA